MPKQIWCVGCHAVMRRASSRWCKPLKWAVPFSALVSSSNEIVISPRCWREEGRAVLGSFLVNSIRRNWVALSSLRPLYSPTLCYKTPTLNSSKYYEHSTSNNVTGIPVLKQRLRLLAPTVRMDHVPQGLGEERNVMDRARIGGEESDRAGKEDQMVVW
ncbi:hypothetical protein BV25DRAFT_1900987 [Artomyces pyxidatus]|uniref:Uncharacterized protein n=1 Tax=Artomyces pyxidatus TaxID=48021 RepID=A0ACB8SWE3_9AGAM|nr:hypothetical protein BV25DRAFT_1900987 [Artomyces pyxidatus]